MAKYDNCTDIATHCQESSSGERQQSTDSPLVEVLRQSKELLADITALASPKTKTPQGVAAAAATTTLSARQRKYPVAQSVRDVLRRVAENDRSLSVVNLTDNAVFQTR